MKAEIWCEEHELVEKCDNLQFIPNVGDTILLDEESHFVKQCGNKGMGYKVIGRTFWINNKGYEDEVAIHVSIVPINKIKNTIK